MQPPARSTRLLAECLLIALLLPALLGWLAQRPGLQEANLFLYDRLLHLRRPAVDPGIAIIGIDAKSIAALGPWPWPRGMEADLLDRLAPAAPRAVMFDLFMTRPAARPEDDARLAAAMARVPVFLPVRFDAATAARPQSRFLPPVPTLARAAAGVGHVNLLVDSDGAVREIHRFEGDGRQQVPYLGMLVAARGGLDLPATRDRPAERGDGWRVQGRFGFRFAGTAASYPVLSFVDVLRGQVPVEQLRDRILLVGTLTDSLLGDDLNVPARRLVAPMPGVEVHANAIQALRAGRTIGFPEGLIRALWTAVPVWLVLLLCVLRPSASTLWVIGGLAGTLAACAALLAWAALWLPAVAPLLGIAIAGVLWSWRRAVDALRHAAR
ncbi:MAG: CHASE2 domain-containing protein [Rhodocyclaceae bacterium]|nr:CHASE2 domain-containing protein [Rhodocyclaceae bacterium]